MSVVVMVDELQAWGPHAKGAAARHFGNGKESCHLMVNGDSEAHIAELHRVADKIGMRREWFQGPPRAITPHYDLTPAKREAALAEGAVFVSAREQAIERCKRRGLR